MVIHGAWGILEKGKVLTFQRKKNEKEQKGDNALNNKYII